MVPSNEDYPPKPKALIFTNKEKMNDVRIPFKHDERFLDLRLNQECPES